MPPLVFDNETSEDDILVTKEEVEVVPRNKEKRKAATSVKKQPQVEREEGDDDDDIPEDEFVVEKITDHLIDEDGELRFQVKWEGYNKKSDRTWEPESNLIETASQIVNDYLQSIGGRQKLLNDWREKKAQASQKKRKSQSSTGTPQGGTNGAKKARKNSEHPASTTPPASSSHTDFKPPTGSWEDEVVGIDACEGAEGSVVVYLTWRNGAKTQHPLNQIYKRCPQKMLKFYESHLVFKRTEPTEAEDDI